MKSLASTIFATATKQMQQAGAVVRLLEITVPTTPKSVYRLANYDRDLQFDTTSAGVPLTWKRFPFALGDFRETRQGDIAQLQVGISNVTREMMANVDRFGGLDGEDIRILTVKADALSDVSAQILFQGKVVNCECDETTILLTLGQPSLNREVFPARRELAQCGVVIFGDSECGYPIPASPTNAVGGGFNFCPRSVAACTERGADEAARGLVQLHPRRFNGRPGLVNGNP